MFKIGNKVRVIDMDLKSYNHIGIYVGVNKQGLAKVYLLEPIKQGKTTVTVISLQYDKIELYNEDDKEKELELINKEIKKHIEQIQKLQEKAFQIEYEMLMEIINK